MKDSITSISFKPSTISLDNIKDQVRPQPDSTIEGILSRYAWFRKYLDKSKKAASTKNNISDDKKV